MILPWIILASNNIDSGYTCSVICLMALVRSRHGNERKIIAAYLSCRLCLAPKNITLYHDCIYRSTTDTAHSLKQNRKKIIQYYRYVLFFISGKKDISAMYLDEQRIPFDITLWNSIPYICLERSMKVQLYGEKKMFF